MNYKEKLIQFNSTKKYEQELRFLNYLVDPNDQMKVLDFGCGIGTAVNYFRGNKINCVGHDKTLYIDQRPDWFYESVYFNFDVCYFMHSFAHIVGIESVLKELYSRINKGGKIVVITPNMEWLKLNYNEHYKPDDTVYRHYNSSELHDLFEEAGFVISNSGQFGNEAGNQHERIFIVAEK